LTPLTSLSAHDGSFAAGLIEAAAQVTVEGRTVLLVAYDLPFPEPMHSLWPIPHPFAVALLLDPPGSPGTPIRADVRPGVARITWPATLPNEWSANPAAHALCVLRPAACGTRERVEIPLTDASHAAVEVG
jgi:beta-ketoacyl synthase-like protein